MGEVFEQPLLFSTPVADMNMAPVEKSRVRFVVSLETTSDRKVDEIVIGALAQVEWPAVAAGKYRLVIELKEGS